MLDRIVRCVRVFGAALYTACWYDDVQCYPYICMFSGLYACPCCFLLMCMKCERVGDDDDDDDPVYVAAWHVTKHMKLHRTLIMLPFIIIIFLFFFCLFFVATKFYRPIFMCLCVPGLTETTRMRCIVKAPWSRGIWRNSAASIDRPPANCIALEPLVIEWLAFIHLLIIIMLAMLTLYIYICILFSISRTYPTWIAPLPPRIARTI